ncbi:hypothetical protein Emag_005031 [Eimeria magna]
MVVIAYEHLMLARAYQSTNASSSSTVAVRPSFSKKARQKHQSTSWVSELETPSCLHTSWRPCVHHCCSNRRKFEAIRSRERMGFGRDALLELHCGLPPEFRSPPLASKSTEIDENSPHPCSNSKPPTAFYKIAASMAAPPKRASESFSGEASAPEGPAHQQYRRKRWIPKEKEQHSGPTACDSSEHKSTSPFSKSRASTSQNRETKHAASAAPPTSHPGRLTSPPGADPGASEPALCVCDEEAEDDVAVYIDDVDDENDVGELHIVEHKVRNKSAAAELAFKSKWVAQMLRKSNRILPASPVSAKSLTASPRVAVDTASHESSHTLNLFQRKLQAFAASMSVDALRLIAQNGQAWLEATSDSDDSEKASDGAGCSSGKPSTFLSSASTSGEPPRAIVGIPASRSRLKQQQRSWARRKLLDGGLPATVLESWRQFLKYARRTCKDVAPRPRIELAAGLESDDDDQQAPLCMCRAGSVQRPSPLISHSLTEYLRASNTIFFKHFDMSAASCSSLPHQGQETPGDPATAASPEEPLPEMHFSARPENTAPELPVGAYGAFGSSVDEVDKSAVDSNSFPAPATDAIPLYQVSVEASDLFGDLMRLDDTARMLEASCTFRLAAAPSKTNRNKRLPPPRPRACEKSLKGGLHGNEVASLQAFDASTVKKDPLELGESKGATSAASTREADPTIVNTSRQLLNRELSRSQTAGGECMTAHSVSAGLGRKQPEKGHLTSAAADETEGYRILYTVQADEETLALSGLDADYCARVKLAFQGAHRAMESLALEMTQPSKTLPQENPEVSAATQKRRRKSPFEDIDLPVIQQDSGSESLPPDDTASQAASREEAGEEADHDQSLMADKLLLAHLMPYLPQYGPH